jgi:hypothetical protein
MDVAAGVPGNESIHDECTTISCAIARKCGSHFTGLHIPHLQRLVRRCGYGVRWHFKTAQCFSSDIPTAEL